MMQCLILVWFCACTASTCFCVAIFAKKSLLIVSTPRLPTTPKRLSRSGACHRPSAPEGPSLALVKKLCVDFADISLATNYQPLAQSSSWPSAIRITSVLPQHPCTHRLQVPHIQLIIDATIIAVSTTADVADVTALVQQVWHPSQVPHLYQDTFNTG